MAGDVIGSAFFDIRANTAGFLGDISGAVSKAEGMFSNMGSGATSKLQGIGGVMTAGITAPIVAGAAFSVKAFEDINTAEDKLIRQTNSTGVAADGMRTSFTNVFGNSPESASQVTDALTTVHNRLGLTGTDLETTTTKAMDLGRILGVDVNTAVDGVAKSLQSFQLPASQADSAMDKLYVVSTKTGAPLTDLTNALSKNGAVAVAGGVSMDVMTASVGSFASAGIPARQGATIVTEAVTKLQGQLGKQDVGNEYNAMMERVGNGTATTADKTLLGQKNYDKLSASLGDATHGYDALKKSMDGSQGAIDKQADSTMTFGEKLTEFKNKLETAFAPLGKTLMTVLENVMTAAKPLIGFLQIILEAFSHMPAPVQLIVVAVLGILAALGPILMILPALVAGFGIISGIFGAISVASIIAFAPIIAVVAVIALIAAGLYLLYNNFKPFHDAVDEVVGWIKTLLGDLMSGDFGKFGDDLKKGFLHALDVFLKFDWGIVYRGIVSGLAPLGNWFKNLLQGFGQWVWNGFMVYFAFAAKVRAEFINILSSFGQWVWNGFMVYFNFSAKLRAEFISILSNFGQWVWNGLITAFNFMTKLRNEFVNLLLGFGQWVWDGLVTAFNFYVKFGNEFANQLLSFGSWVWGGIGTLWDDLKGKFKEVADYFGGLINNILHNTDTSATTQDKKDYSSGQSTLDIILNRGFGAATGGYVQSYPGGRPVIVGEGGEGEYIIPESKMGHGGLISGGLVSASGSASKTSQSGDTHFHVQFNNATLTSVNEADKLGRRMAYSATEYLRRSGHLKG